jgi:hypothetical protein
MRRQWPRSGVVRRRWLSCAAGLMGLAGAATGHAFSAPDGEDGGLIPIAIFGSDDRVPLPSRLAPLRERIGVLFNIRQRSVCSAFCVDPSTIGTAAHCLFKTAGEKPPKLSDFWFARNYDAVRDYARIAGYDRGSAAQNIVAGTYALSTTPPIDAARDWAFVRLSRPVCSKGGLAIETMPVEQVMREAKADHVFQISYHKDYKQWQPAYSKPCQVERTFGGIAWSVTAADFNTPEHLLLHTCDTGGASSGSPLFVETPTGPKVIGINVGTYVQSKALVPHQSAEKGGGEPIANMGVASIAFAPRLAAFRAAVILSNIGALKELQERLQKAGLYRDAVDGNYGPALKAAIEVFEAGEKLPQTGIASEMVLSRLRALQTAGATKPPAR